LAREEWCCATHTPSQVVERSTGRNVRTRAASPCRNADLDAQGIQGAEQRLAERDGSEIHLENLV
jgi:hypothetical protein